MNDFFYQERARDDFNRARLKELLSQLKNFINPEDQDLLSFKEVLKIIKPKNEVYKGMQVVPVSKIVGSEGRYKDFNKAFFPKYDHLRYRWESVDKAHLKNVILPPITLYEIGGVYFVRDGNHRVSVAKIQRVKSIDAEVISLSSEIKLKPHMSKAELRTAVINYEKEDFYNQTMLENIIPKDELNFSTTGRFDAVLMHIEVHKYYINQSFNHEISLEEAAKSWKENVFNPIVNIINEEKILSRFPGRTSADLYLWIVFHWDELKKKYGEDYPINIAARDYTLRYGKNYFQQFIDFLKKIYEKIKKIITSQLFHIMNIFG